MRFFTDKASLASLKIFITAAVVGVPLEVVPLDLSAHDNSTEEFLQMSPFGLVPVLEVDKDKGQYLWECTSICRYTLTKQKKLSFMPKEGTKDRALAEQWIEFIDSTESVDEILQHAEKTFSDAKYPSRGKFLFGESLSLADIFLWCAIYPRSAELPQCTKAWFDSLAREKHFISGLERAGIQSPSDVQSHSSRNHLIEERSQELLTKTANLSGKLAEIEARARHAEVRLDEFQTRINEIENTLANVMKEHAKTESENAKLRYRVNHLIRMLEEEEKKHLAQ